MKIATAGALIAACGLDDLVSDCIGSGVPNPTPGPLGFKGLGMFRVQGLGRKLKTLNRPWCLVAEPTLPRHVERLVAHAKYRGKPEDSCYISAASAGGFRV